MRLTDGIYEQLQDTYRRMAQARYRPAAPSDGFGNTTVPLEELDLDQEAGKYALTWWEDEERQDFWIGCCDYPTRPATVFAVEAARLMCGAAPDDLVARLLRLALDDLEAS